MAVNKFDKKGIEEDLRSVLDIKDRYYKLKIYKNSFLGSDCVNAIIKLGYATNIRDAVALGNIYIGEGMFCRVPKENFREKIGNMNKKKEMQRQAEIPDVVRDDIFVNGLEFYRFIKNWSEIEGQIEIPSKYGQIQQLWKNHLAYPPLDIHPHAPQPHLQHLRILGSDANPTRSEIRAKMHAGEKLTSIAMISPFDEHNSKLLDNIYPLEWENPPQPVEKYNLVVLGGGSNGIIIAQQAAEMGARVALVEKHIMGGNSFSFGNLPARALQHSAKMVHQVHNVGKFGVEVENVKVNFDKVMQRVRQIRSETSFAQSAQRLKLKYGVDIYMGKGEFVSNFQILVKDRVLEFMKCIICTGTQQAFPQIIGLESIQYLTTQTIYNLQDLPKTIAILGGDKSGVEFSQILQRLGCQVTLIVSQNQILPAYEDLVAVETVTSQLQNEGVKIMLNCDIDRIIANQDGSVKLCYNQGNKETCIEVEKVLIASGFLPAVQGIRLQKAGIVYDSIEGIKVNDEMQTSNSIIYAVGGCTQQNKHQPACDQLLQLVLSNVLFNLNVKASTILVPIITYTEPAIAHVGLYQSNLLEQNICYTSYNLRMIENDKAISESDEQGQIIIYALPGQNKIFGATIVSNHAEELISEITLSIQQGIGASQVAQLCHPTISRSQAIGACSKVQEKQRQTKMMKYVTKSFFDKMRSSE